MSNTANWSYTNVATIRPRQGEDEWGNVSYGPEYTIACTWAAEASQQRDNNGAEFVGRHTIYTEDLRPKFLDLISFDGSNGWEEIRSVTQWDMSPFGETPDVKLIT
ncbi:hypothetical protein NJI34_41610 [Pseudomonas sp. S 311-6]|nr:hypothetical protein [Pseudomonas sp. S 311-6]